MHRLVVSLSSAALIAAATVVALASPAAATEEDPDVCLYVLVQGDDLEEFRPINPCLPVAATDCVGTKAAAGTIVVVTVEACYIGL